MGRGWIWMLLLAAKALAAGPVDEVELEVGGRLFARAMADERTEWERRLSVPSARAEVTATFGIAKAVLEADLASSSLIKDAYVRLSPQRGLGLYAGQFKAPFLLRRMESQWSLPLISRGLVEDYLTSLHQLGGRRVGLMGEVRARGLGGLRLSAGAFQGGRDELGQRLSEDLSLRVSAKPWSFLELGASGYQADALGERQRLAGGADASLRVGALRVVAEALAGRLPTGRFGAGLLLASYRLRLDDTWALEPLAAVEALRLVGPQPGMGRAAVAGANLHYGSRLKLQLQGERGLWPGDEADRTRAQVQLGVRF